MKELVLSAIDGVGSPIGSILVGTGVLVIFLAAATVVGFALLLIYNWLRPKKRADLFISRAVVIGCLTLASVWLFITLAQAIGDLVINNWTR